jgi:hypothetical protein
MILLLGRNAQKPMMVQTAFFPVLPAVMRATCDNLK